jgi:hypothetical protein
MLRRFSPEKTMTRKRRAFHADRGLLGRYSAHCSPHVQRSSSVLLRRALLFMSFFGDVSMKSMMLWAFDQMINPVLLASPCSSWREFFWVEAGSQRSFGLCRRFHRSHKRRAGSSLRCYMRNNRCYFRKRFHWSGCYRSHYDTQDGRTRVSQRLLHIVACCSSFLAFSYLRAP